MEQKHVRQRRRNSDDSPGVCLFDAIIQRARQSGDLVCAEPILEFCHACTPETEMGMEVLREPHKFDFVPSLIYGANEGIYLDCCLVGRTNEHGQYSLRIGVMKTLSAGIEDCKIMGELCGVLMYHARKYMNEQIHDCVRAPRRATTDKRASNHRRQSVVSQ